MSVVLFTLPNCNYCSLQKDCKIKFDKSFNDNLFGALKKVTLPNGIGIELNCAYFSPNKDAFKIRIKENGDIESLGMNKESE
jgi:hypothetical protein